MRVLATLGLSAAALCASAGVAAWIDQAPPPAAPAVVAAMPPAAGSSVAVAPAAPGRGGDLPTRDVPARPMHSIREDVPLPTPPVTLLNRNGQVITRIAGSPP